MNLEKKTILIVDDTETNIDILLELLCEKYDLLVAIDGYSALEILREESVDLILLDIMMPGIDGYKVCNIVKSDIKTKEIPVIFITAKVDEDSIEKAYDIGGADYIAKPFKPKELLARVKTQLDLVSLIKHLEFIASHDEMTGIYNRRKFFELATHIFESTPQNLYAIMIDIDKFKNINDTYGHPTGDKVIKLVTQTISSMLCEEAIFARVGGEEFVILCHYSSDDFIMHKIETIRDAISKLEISCENSDSIMFTISNGIAKVTPEVASIDDLLKEADKALYEAKEEGRNRVIFRN